MSNPLLADGLPAFGRIQPEHLEPAIDSILADNRALIEALLRGGAPFTWASLVQPLELANDRLARAWGAAGHLNGVINSDPLRQAYNACLPKVSDYYTELGQHEGLYGAYKGLQDADGLNPVQRKVVADALREFHLSGVDLPPERKARFKAVSQELSTLGNRFAENLLDATNGWHKLVTDEAALAGLPQSAKDLARQAAQQNEQEGWRLTLDLPSYLPVMNYADHRELRRELYQAYVTRASELGPHAGQWDNGPLMERILALRHEQAQLLGFASFADASLARKMAPSVEGVLGFLHDLARRSRPQAERELEEVRAFAREGLGVAELEAWDIGYYSEKLREARYAITQEDLKPYFPETRVLPGLFEVMERLFGVKVNPVDSTELWHPDVRFYEIRDAEGIRGHFFLDLYARRNKRGGAWMDDGLTRFFDAGRAQTPVAHLVCNFSPPVGDKPALFTHDEVQTLFHEFGHGIHHLLTQVDYPPVAGINGVEWDAVELPSQFLENWCWEREALDHISGHWERGEPIPQALYDKMIAARNFQSAMKMVRQLEFALFDFRLHAEYDPAQGGRIYDLLRQVRSEVAVIQPPEWNRMPHSFSHIFAGGYAAGYYSYKWAEVLSADAFSLFEERGVFDPETGRAFLHHILEQGGSRPAMELFVAFRGRPPSVDALLRHGGILG
jgi:oligopeptidase A